MERQLYGQQSHVKTLLLNDISRYVRSATQYYRTKIAQIVCKIIDKPTLMDKTYVLDIATGTDREDLELLYLSYESSSKDEEIINWYIRKVLSEAVDSLTVKQCIPSCYHTNIDIGYFTGDKEVADLFDQRCYDILNNAPMNNILLGIGDN